MDENREKNETCKKCSCNSWGCPADWWDDDGIPMAWNPKQPTEEAYIIPSFCYQSKESGNSA